MSDEQITTTEPTYKTFGMHGPLTKELLAKLSTVELIALHNAALPPDGKPVKVFHTKAKGVAKVWDLYSASTEEELATVATQEVTPDGDDGVAAGDESNTNEDKEMSKEKAKKAPKAKKTGGGTRSHIADDTKIKVVAKENPYREGTKAHATFALFGKVDTVGEARKKADSAKHDLGYLRYSSRDGHIKLG